MSEDALELQMLIRAAQRGDESAFETLLTRFETYVFRCVYALLGNRADAEDVTQQVFIKLWRTLPRYRFDATFSTYLTKMAHNAARDHLRHEKHRSRMLSPGAADEDGEDYSLPIADGSQENDPVQSYLSKERLQILQDAIEQLPPQLREIVVLRTQYAHSYAALSDILGLPQGTVKSRLYRAKNILLKFLENGNFFE